MTTQAQTTANRRNAKKSTGPRTQQGKSTVSQNAVKHGLLASQAVIASEDKTQYNEYRDQFLAELSPTTPMESMLADRIINLSWRLYRANRFQNQTIDELNTRDKNDPLKNLTNRLLRGQPLIKDDPSNPTPDLPLGRLAIRDFSNNRVLERLLMYERRIENSLYKTVLEYQRQILIRTLDEQAETATPFYAKQTQFPRQVTARKY